MDIHCPNCDEAWDTHHLRYDEPHEWGLAEFMVKDFIDGGSHFSGPDDMVRLAAVRAGWQFASDSVLSFTRCPACKAHEQRGHIDSGATERQALVAMAAELLGDDVDGLASELADLSHFNPRR